MYYSLTFSYDKPNQPLFFGADNRTYGGIIQRRNTWVDWHLVQTSRPSITPPEVKTKTVDVPGMNGDLDLSESLTGYSTYNNRKGSIEFMVLTGYEHWHEIYQSMCSFFNGKKVYFACEDDPAYYYYGRIKVNNYESEKDNSKISIEYDLEPYKYEYTDGRNGGFFDIFDFESELRDGVKYTTKFTDTKINSDDYIQYCDTTDWGNYTELPIVPTFNVRLENPTDYIEIHFTNPELNIDVTVTYHQSGSYRNPKIIFSQLKNWGKKYYDMSAQNYKHRYDPQPITTDQMNYQDQYMTLEVRGHGNLEIIATPGRM